MSPYPPEELISIFERRSSKLQRAASVFLVLALIVLAAGVAVVIYAPALTESDVSFRATSYDDRIKASRTKRESESRQFEKAAPELADLNKACEAAYHHFFSQWPPITTVPGDDNMFHSLNFDETPAEAEIAQAVRKVVSEPRTSEFKLLGIAISIPNCGAPQTFVRSPSDYAPIIDALLAAKVPIDRDKLNQLATQQSALLDDIHFQDRVIGQIDVQKVAAAAGVQAQSDRPVEGSQDLIARLVQTSVTRFGLLAIAGFFVGILVSLYRYNVRLAAFYLARADLFRMFPDRAITVSEATAILSSLTPSLEFGKSPQLPLEQIVDLFKSARDPK